METKSAKQLCVHALGNSKQALATAPDEHGVQTLYCAPCLSECIEAMLEIQSPESIADVISFDGCGHYEPDQICETCYIGVMGCLQLFWAHLKHTGDNRTGNRLLRLLRAFAREYGPTNYMSRQRYRASSAQSAQRATIK